MFVLILSGFYPDAVMHRCTPGLCDIMLGVVADATEHTSEHKPKHTPSVKLGVVRGGTREDSETLLLNLLLFFKGALQWFCISINLGDNAAEAEIS